MNLFKAIGEWFTSKREGVEKWQENRSEKHATEIREEQRNDVLSTYKIVIKDDAMWILCGNNALYRAESNETVKDVADKMKAFEQVNLAYKELN